MIFWSYLVILLIPGVLSTTCPHSVNSKIQECVQPVADYAKVLNNQDSRTSGSEFGSAFSLPNMGGRVFNELCRLIAKFNSCVRDYRSTCPRHVTISLIDSSYGYLCNEGYNTFMESAECLMELDRKPSVKDAMMRRLKKLNQQTLNQVYLCQLKLIGCVALNFFSGCVRSPIKQDCGFSAWQVIYRVLKDTTNTLMPACQFTGTSQKLLSFQKEIDSLNNVTSTTTTLQTSTYTTSRPRPTVTKLQTTTVVVVRELADGEDEDDEELKQKLSQKKKMRKIQSAELTDSSKSQFSIEYVLTLVLGFLILCI